MDMYDPNLCLKIIVNPQQIAAAVLPGPPFISMV